MPVRQPTTYDSTTPAKPSLASPVGLAADDDSATTAACDLSPALSLLSRHEAVAAALEVTFGGMNLVVPRGVFCPTLTNTSKLLLNAVDVRPGERVLDAFSGSGAFAVY